MFQNSNVSIVRKLILRLVILAISTVLFYYLGWTTFGDFFYSNSFAALAMIVPIISMFLIEVFYAKIKEASIRQIGRIYLLLSISIPLLIIVLYISENINSNKVPIIR